MPRADTVEAARLLVSKNLELDLVDLAVPLLV